MQGVVVQEVQGCKGTGLQGNRKCRGAGSAGCRSAGSVGVKGSRKCRGAIGCANIQKKSKTLEKMRGPHVV